MEINSILLIISVMFSGLFAVSWADLPPEIQKCKSTDNHKCIGKTVEEILKRYPKGNTDFGMPNISAFETKNLKISRSNPSSPIQINFEFIKCTTYGFENAKILRTSGFNKQLKNAEMLMFVPNMKMHGDYEMTGKILLLPINGKGKGEVNLKDSNITLRVKMEKVAMRDNKTYLKVKKIKALVEPKQMFVNFENLFNGNTILSKTLNDVINENWKDVWTELQDGINHAMEVVVENVANNVYKVLALEDMYSD